LSCARLIVGRDSGIGKALELKFRNTAAPLFTTTRREDSDESFDFDANSLSLPKSLLEDISIYDEIQLFLCIGTIGKQSSIDNVARQDFEQALLINALYITAILKSLLSMNSVKSLRVVHYGTAAANKPYFGWSTYCVSKAAASMLLRCFDFEYQSKDNILNIIEINPGAVDTHMQHQIRDAALNKVAFRNSYNSPKYVAENTKNILDDPKYRLGYHFISLNEYAKKN